MKKIGALLLLVLLCMLCFASCEQKPSHSDTNDDLGGDETLPPDDGSEDTPATFTVTFDSCGGSFLNPIAQEEGALLTAPAAPTRDGYVFAGWYADAAYTTLFVFGKMPSENITLYAKWLHVTTVTFETNGGSAVSPIAKTEGSVFEAPLPPTRSGFVFVGWYADAAYTTLYVFGEIPAEDITLYAKWSADPIIYFETNGGSTVAPVTQPMGTALLAPNDPIKWFHTFDGWYTDESCTELYTFTVMPAENITLYAKWTPYTYTIQFESNGGNKVDPITQPYNTTVTAPEDPVKTGYVFLGWYTDELCTEAYVFTVMPAGNITLYAKWQVPYYTVTFKYVDPNGNAMADWRGYTEKTVMNIGYGKEAKNDLFEDPTAFADYVIIGWNEDLAKAKAGEIDENCVKSVKSNKTVYSVVREKVYFEIKFKNPDGTVFNTVSMKEGSAVDDTIPHPVCPGKYFKMWQLVEEDVDSSINCIRDDCSFVAVFGSTDGIIGKVAKNTIILDGKRDEAYNTSGAYLPVNLKRQADQETAGSYDVNTVNPNTGSTGTRGVPTVDVDTWIVWDGDYIYLCIEVSDKSLVGRNQLYVKGGIDAYLNDAVELWYSFEQDATLTKNETRVGLDAMGTATYALGRSLGIGGGRSTHYDEIKYHVRNNLLGDTGSDLSRTGYVGNAEWKSSADGEEPEYLASYIMELKIPAWTEGAADISIPGIDTKTGRLPGKAEDSNKKEDYAFTSGMKLQAGDFVRFNIQVHDLMISQSEMTGAVGTYFWDCPPIAKVLDDWPRYDPFKHKTMLFATDGNGTITGQADTYGRFSAAGNTQRDVEQYVMFTLGDTGEAETKIWSMGTTGAKNTSVFYTKTGEVYVRK